MSLKMGRPSIKVAHSAQGSISGSSDRTPLTGESNHSPSSSIYSSEGSTTSIKHEVMCGFLSQTQSARQWIVPEASNQGVLLRKRYNEYISDPPSLVESVFAQECARLNVQCAMTIYSKIVDLFIDANWDKPWVPLQDGRRIQFLPHLALLSTARKHQFAAFIASERMLVVWDDDPANLIHRASSIEAELISLVWKQGIESESSIEDKEQASAREVQLDSESGLPKPEARPVRLSSSVWLALTIMLLLCMTSLGLRQVAAETKFDKKWYRVGTVAAVLPTQLFLALFFCQTIVTTLAQIFGPVKRLYENSEFYSGKKPPRLRDNLPHVTIQCPVYKEGLDAVIGPTINSLTKAITTYELQGGSASIFVNDDGMRLLGEAERQARVDFYSDHNIGWVARPAEGDAGFVRRGRFKKASNLNFGLMISNKVEDQLALVERHACWTQDEEDDAYEQALQDVVDDDGRAWAAGNIRIGDYILLVDSDTRVPSDCLLDAVSELEQAPQVAILQFSSTVLQVVHTYFEDMITYFTNLIYTSIAFSVSNGELAAFVGHNAILRWSALQDVSYFDELDGCEKYWSESHVSEDFDMALRLQIAGYSIRYAAWAGDGFKEGVSLTVYDELARWEKYAFGCDELLFNPIYKWIYKGPFTPLFRKFIFSNLRMSCKVGVLSYVGTYYAIAFAWIGCTANYVMVGLWNGYLDKYYVDSWKIYLSVIAVFGILSPIGLAAMRYRSGARSLLGGYWESLRYMPLMMIFFGGISMHLSQSILAHLFSLNKTWGTTAKEAETSNFFTEAPKILRNFKFTMFWAFAMVAAMAIMAKAQFVPFGWHINRFIAIFPLAACAGSHILLPIALNPALMTFSW